MLVQKLNISDLQSGSGMFDGTMVYAQNKVQRKVLETKPTACLLGGLYTVCFAKSFAKTTKKNHHCGFSVASDLYRDARAIIFSGCPALTVCIILHGERGFQLI